ncbi:chitin disaccharide deacetylase [Bacillus sp. JJ1764]|uniref:chitin disaccharide deacetylase n=1 Tax=Bacillus sp. JJ1764 TaxID=3122964 RepID=UPI002FFFD23D
MIKLIMNADDFGYSRGVNYGIIDSHLLGIVNSTTMMMNMPGVDHAIELAKRHPSLQVGIHLVLTCGKPLLNDVPTLVDAAGNFKKLSTLGEADLSLAELEREWEAQIELFLNKGLKPTHLDSHHHVHTRDELLPVVQKLANKYDLPVRTNGLEPIKGVKPFTDAANFDFYGNEITEESLIQLMRKIEDGTTVEIMCHPAYVDNELLKGSSYNTARLRELEILVNIKLPDYVELV